MTTIEKIDALLLSGVKVEDVIDRVIHLNQIIGVGKISLGDHLRGYCRKHPGYQRPPCYTCRFFDGSAMEYKDSCSALLEPGISLADVIEVQKGGNIDCSHYSPTPSEVERVIKEEARAARETSFDLHNDTDAFGNLFSDADPGL